MPSARQASRFTRGSVSALLQRSNCRRAMLSPVNPERTCSRAPIAGAEDQRWRGKPSPHPAAERGPFPVAPVMYCARSTNNCSAESSSVSSSVRLPFELSPTASLASALPQTFEPSPRRVLRIRSSNGSPGWADSAWNCCQGLVSAVNLRNIKKANCTEGLNRVSPWRPWLSRAGSDCKCPTA
jgi:hypothetical protein